MAMLIGIAIVLPAQAKDPLSALAARIDDAEAEADSWPFSELPPELQRPLSLAILQDDAKPALKELTAELGSTTLARSVLRASLKAVQALPLGSQRIIELEAGVLQALRAQPSSEAVIGAVWLFYSTSYLLPEEEESLTTTLKESPELGRLALRLVRMPGAHWLRSILAKVILEHGVDDIEAMTALAEALDSHTGRLAAYGQALELARDGSEAVEIRKGSLPAYLAAGRPVAAARIYSALPASDQQALLGRPSQQGPQNSLQLDLIAALLLADDLEAARSLLDRPPSAPVSELWQALEILHTPRSEDPFEILKALAVETLQLGDDTLFSGVILEALSRLSVREGYRSFATFFHHLLKRHLAQERALEISDPELRRQFLNELTALELRIEIVGDLVKETSDPISQGIRERLAQPLRPWFQERVLPKGIPVGSEEMQATRVRFQGLPAEWSLIRSERQENHIAVVALSRSLDPDTNPEGYWVARSHDGGNSWALHYTGLRLLQPYEILPKSSLPLMSEDGLQAEVRILDPGRNPDGRYLLLPWSELERDRDADGLSDLVEERLLTDPELADTDGDGIQDDVDPLPLIPLTSIDDWRPTAFVKFLKVRDFETCLGTEEILCSQKPPPPGASETRFILSERSNWKPLTPSHRTIILDASELALMKAKLGMFNPNSSIPFFELDRSQQQALGAWYNFQRLGFVTQGETTVLLHRIESFWFGGIYTRSITLRCP